jgi:hypothetical protein
MHPFCILVNRIKSRNNTKMIGIRVGFATGSVKRIGDASLVATCAHSGGRGAAGSIAVAAGDRSFEKPSVKRRFHFKSARAPQTNTRAGRFTWN